MNTLVKISDLRAALEGAAFMGQVIAPDEEGYEAARTPFYGGFDKRPAAILRPSSASEVAQVIRLARQLGLELAVRSGGHSLAGYGVSDGGLVLDLAALRRLEIDPERRTAWAGTGLTAGEYTKAADAYGLATGFGDTGSVGIGGITLGGGIGFLVRKYGLTIDSLLAAEVVTADGAILQVDETHHSDLFWALRGGGGNFGVATRFQYRLHPTGDVFGGMLVLPARAEVIAGFVAAAQAAPDELSTIANIMPAPPMPSLPAELHGKLILLAMLMFAGPPEAGERAAAPFRGLAKPLADMLQPMRYAGLFEEEEGDYHPTAAGLTMFMDAFDLTSAEAALDFLQRSDAPMKVVQVRALGGAMARVPDAATAFAHRRRPLAAGMYAFYNAPEERQARQAWAEALATALERGPRGAYVNFMGVEGPERVQAAYPGPTWERLRRIKARYDPANLFHLNQNIPPLE